VPHTGKAGIKELEAELRNLLETRGVGVADDIPELVLALGGDGTMLRAAQVAHRSDALLLGVNFGALGYLTEVEAGDATRALERIFSDDFAVEERMMLQCTANNDERSTYVGLNEVLVERASRHRLVKLSVRVGGEGLAAFNADGMIVASPTGSTAYALSAGGPIVSPRAQSLVLVPVSPHMVFSRPIVLAPDEVVEITVEASEEASLSLDGAIGCPLPPGARVEVRRHPRALKLVRLSGPGFLARLRAKLLLSG
jgi:NAD+ kinase